MQIIVKENSINSDLRRRIRAMNNTGNLMQSIGTELVSMAQGAFSDPALRPEPWASLKFETLRRKAKKKQGCKPLIATGTMARSPRVIEHGTKHVVVGSDRLAGTYSRAAIHQLGAPEANIPARPFFPFTGAGTPTNRAKKRVRDIMIAWLK